MVALTLAVAACGGSPAAPSSPVTATPVPTFALSGLVTDSSTGNGIAGATVAIVDGPNSGRSATTDATGSFIFAALQQSGFTVNASAASYVATSKSVTLTANQTLTIRLTRQSTPPGTTAAGVRYDNIAFAHQFIVGSPVPTQNQTATYCCWPLPVRNAGTYTFNLAGFPLDRLPSGGSSNMISDSEMLLVGLNVSPASTAMSFEFHKAANQDTVVYTFAPSQPLVWGYAFIGHFSWEINEPGSYYVIVGSSSGSARLDFLVTSSTTTDHLSARAATGYGGGGGGWSPLQGFVVAPF
ncbi:MAG TPA: carboxypeptidase regulatory-like domain-containing protein [Vicinamibacterales bacterium]|nr:carboxypeptidase regulatory-like domain-containing protein [Vicinamibacterales bacterium]